MPFPPRKWPSSNAADKALEDEETQSDGDLSEEDASFDPLEELLAELTPLLKELLQWLKQNTLKAPPPLTRH